MKEPLTLEQLLAIQERNPDSADVRALLWEIRRLRAVILKTHDYFRQPPNSSTAQMMHERSRSDLEEEPVVKESTKL